MVQRGMRDSSEDNVFGVEEALAKISMNLVEPKGDKIFTISDITPEEVFGLAVLLSYSKKFKSSVMKNWVRYFLLLRVSRLRMGRKESLMLGVGMRESAEGRKKIGAKDLFAGLG